MLLQELSVTMVVKLSNWSTHVNGVPYLEGIQMLRHLTSQRKTFTWWVGFDDKLNTSNIVVRCDGCVSSHDHLAIDISGQEDVLAGGQAQDMLRRLKCKVKLERVAAEDRLFLQHERLLVLGIQRNLAPSLLADPFLNGLLLSERARVQVSDVEFFKHLCRLGGVDGDEILSRILSSVDEDRVSTTGVKVKVFCAIIHLLVHNDPDIFLFVVLFDFHHGDELSLARRLSGRGGCVCLCVWSNTTLIKQTSKTSGVRLL
mmetsp:Transcript_17777/g.26898  ORF Transcript_17777/g.26898 Transcript_17777/m.26898 type:complete len:258 (-) Transcript_17777:94-867(-)